MHTLHYALPQGIGEGTRGEEVSVVHEHDVIVRDDRRGVLDGGSLAERRRGEDKDGLHLNQENKKKKSKYIYKVKNKKNKK